MAANTDAIDFAALTENQRDVLGQVAMNNDGGHHRKTLESLVAKGLIQEYPERHYGGLIVRRYSMPIHVHIAWCQWCSEHDGDDE